MIFKVQQTNRNVAETIRDMTGDFLDFSMSEIKEGYPNEYCLMNTSTSRLRGVYRHSLCMALDLPSKPAYHDIAKVYPVYARRMRKFTKKYANTPESYRMGVLQAGVNCWMKTTGYRKEA